MASIRLQNVDKKYENGFHAVRNLDLEIDDGELMVLVGPSGCGKSTTLRMVAGLEEVSSGQIRIGERVVNEVPPGDRDIAMVFQNYALYPHMTVRQNLAFGLKMRKTPKPEIQRRVDNVAKILSIEPLLDRRPKQLSGGQRQRVAVGRAIVRDPQVFLFDEPLSNLDAKLRVRMRWAIAALHHRLKTTMIYVTHDQVEAMTLGDRIVIMHNGVVQQVDSPMNLYNRPANRFVAGFIGSPAMNFVEGEVNNAEFVYRDSRIPVDSAVPDGTVVMGVRPEDLEIDGAGPVLTKVTLEVVEYMGHETMVYFQLSGVRQVARLDGSASCRPGDQITLRIKPSAWHLFAADDAGARLN